MPIDFYQTASSAPCRAIAMVAKEIGISLVKIPFKKLIHVKNIPDIMNVDIDHCFPTINDHGFFLWESRAIITYLMNSYAPRSRLYPENPERRAQIDRMLYFDVEILYYAMGDYLYPKVFKAKPYDRDKEKIFFEALKQLDIKLSKSIYVAGDHFSIADITIFAGLTFADAVKFDFTRFPRVYVWLENLKVKLPYHNEINAIPLEKFLDTVKPNKPMGRNSFLTSILPPSEIVSSISQSQN